jgi:phospholipase/carboxylesterase
MRIDRIGELDVRITGGTDREGGGDGPVVVLLHGFGAPGDDLVSLWRGLDVPTSTRFVFPAGSIALESVFGDARAWWQIDFQRIQRASASGSYDSLATFEPPGLTDARAIVIRFLDEVERRFGIDGDQLVLGGFSQGANLSTDIALTTERKLAGLVHLSGSVLRQPMWEKGMPRRASLPVFISHGRNDEVLPFALSERLANLWRANGNAPTWGPFSGGHEIPWSVTEALGVFLTRVLGRSS